MDPHFKKWIIKRVERYEPEERKRLLDLINNNIDYLKDFIRERLIDWSIIASIELDRPLMISNTETEAAEVLNAIKELFAAELQTV